MKFLENKYVRFFVVCIAMFLMVSVISFFAFSVIGKYEPKKKSRMQVGVAEAAAQMENVEDLCEYKYYIPGPDGTSAYMYIFERSDAERYVVTISNQGNVTVNRVR